MTFNNPLDLMTLLVGTFSGSWEIFLFAALIFLTILAARFKLNNITLFMLIGLFAILMANYIPWFYVFIIIITGFIIFFIIGRLIKN